MTKRATRIALRYLLVTVFVSGVVAWWGHASDHNKHVDYLPPPITAPGALNPNRTPRVLGSPKPSDLNFAKCWHSPHRNLARVRSAVPFSKCRGMKFK